MGFGSRQQHNDTIIRGRLDLFNEFVVKKPDYHSIINMKNRRTNKLLLQLHIIMLATLFQLFTQIKICSKKYNLCILEFMCIFGQYIPKLINLDINDAICISDLLIGFCIFIIISSTIFKTISLSIYMIMLIPLGLGIGMLTNILFYQYIIMFHNSQQSLMNFYSFWIPLGYIIYISLNFYFTKIKANLFCLISIAFLILGLISYRSFTIIPFDKKVKKVFNVKFFLLINFLYICNNIDSVIHTRYLNYPIVYPNTVIGILNLLKTEITSIIFGMCGLILSTTILTKKQTLIFSIALSTLLYWIIHNYKIDNLDIKWQLRLLYTGANFVGFSTLGLVVFKDLFYVLDGPYYVFNISIFLAQLLSTIKSLCVSKIQEYIVTAWIMIYLLIIVLFCYTEI